MEEDDKIKNIFAGFSPELSSDFIFMKELERRIESVEIVKRHMARTKRRNKAAIAIAAAVGFIVGFLFSLAMPYITRAIADWQLTLPDTSGLNMIADNIVLLTWLIIGVTSCVIALNSYELSLSIIKSRERRHD